MMNSVYGPGMFILPVAILNTGWVTVAIVNLLLCGMAACSSLMLAEAMVRIDGNAQWQLQVQFTTLVQAYLSPEWATVARVCYHMSLFLMNVVGLVLCAQAFDNLLIWTFGVTFALEVSPHLEFRSLLYDTVTERDGINTIYSGFIERLGITLGYVLAVLVVVPLGLNSVTSSIRLNIVSFTVTSATLLVLFVHF